MADRVLHHTVVPVSAQGIVRGDVQRGRVGPTHGRTRSGGRIAGLPGRNHIPLVTQGSLAAGNAHGKFHFDILPNALVGRRRSDFKHRVALVYRRVRRIFCYCLYFRRPSREYVEVLVIGGPYRRGARIARNCLIFHLPAHFQPGSVPVAPDNVVSNVIPIGFVNPIDKVRASNWIRALYRHLQFRILHADLWTRPAGENIILTPWINEYESICIPEVYLRIVRQHAVIGNVGNGTEIGHRLLRPNRIQWNVALLHLDDIAGEILRSAAIFLRIPLYKLIAFPPRSLVGKLPLVVLLNPERLGHILYRLTLRVFVKIYQFHIMVKWKLNNRLLVLRGRNNVIIHGFFHVRRSRRIVGVRLP